MLSRRSFGACAICTVTGGLVASPVEAQQGAAQTPGVTRNLIQTTDLDERHVAILAIAEIAPGVTVARHTHPGIESSVVMEGSATLSAQGQPDKQFRAGEGFQVAPGVPHSAQAGDRGVRLAITYVVEKGKPLASPA